MNTLPKASIKSLLLSCLFSFLLAIILLLTAVLPAEYNIDPTGLGEKMGLTTLAQVTTETIQPMVVSCNDQTETAADEKVSVWQDSVMITVPARKGLEYKFHIKKGEKFEFSWKTSGPALYFDFHGEPQGDTSGYFKSFKESTQAESSGTLTTPFTGSHGWYWENKSNRAVNISLKTRGQYSIKGLM